MNIPGAKRHRHLLEGFANIVPELLRYSSSGGLINSSTSAVQKRPRTGATSEGEDEETADENEKPVDWEFDSGEEDDHVAQLSGL